LKPGFEQPVFTLSRNCRYRWQGHSRRPRQTNYCRTSGHVSAGRR
jgi:hypothetical protein